MGKKLPLAALKEVFFTHSGSSCKKRRRHFAMAFFALALMVLAALPSGALSTAFNSWIRSGQSVNVEDQSFTVYLSSRTNEIIADYGTGSLFVKNNSCDATGIARICLDNVEYDQTERAYKINVRGISLAPVITIAREVSKNEILIGESVTFTVTLRNTGGIARNVTHQEVFPSAFKVIDSDGVRFAEDNVVWKGKLDTDEAVSFSYKVKSVGSFDGGIVSSLTYFDGLRHKTLYSGRVSLKTSPPVILETIIGSSSAIVGERDNLTVNLTNRLPETAIVAVEVTFDPRLKVTSWPYRIRNVSPSVFAWSDEITRVTNRTTNTSNMSNAWINLSKAWLFEFKAAKVGNSIIKVRAAYRPASEESVNALPEAKQSVLVSNKGVIVRTSVKDSTFEANQRNRVKVWLQNLNPYARITGVNVNTSTSLLYLPDAYLEKMGPGEQVLLADTYFYAPGVDKGTGYVISTNVSYLTEFGDNFSTTFKDTATVAPSQDISFTQTVSSTSAKPDEELSVAVNVRNQRLSGFRNIRVLDNVSPEFFVIGKNSAVLEAKSKETVNAYSYKLKVPNVGSQTVLHVNTTLTYDEVFSSVAYLDPKSFTSTKVTTVTVQPESLPLAISRTTDDSDIYAGEQFNVRYAITNAAKGRAAVNIVLTLPLTGDFDLVGSAEQVIIGRLDPGETVAVSNSDVRRAKKGGSFEMPPAVLDYESEYGNNYSVNGTRSAISVKDNLVNGPLIFIDKAAPKLVNNTDDFVVSLRIRNAGDQPVSVSIEDDGRSYVIAMDNNTEQVINRSQRHTFPGIVTLPKAKATYSFEGVSYLVGSSDASVEVVNNPVLSLSKLVPFNATNAEPFGVSLSVKNNVGKEVENITITDGERSWLVESLHGSSHANITYKDSISSLGTHKLSPAAATYVFEKSVYSIVSNSPSIKIEEKELVSITKEIFPGNATRGANVKVSLNVKSLHSEAIEASVSDGSEKFDAVLEPGAVQKFTYEAEAGNETASPASVSYALNGHAFSGVSPTPEFALLEEEERESVAIKQKRGGLGSLLRALLNILTWKRGE